ncbi:response regulator [Alkalicaulis satelles]|uniref:histidine kinase n=1 Tax=Alkalicaulis satelles TaxID=2609175 RepID=A0A5M6Z8F6_9PROT|nr:GAF domain-containing hybrid sensor histidine kinase/response regulator [Alkalicaulis satelles]KAA5800906.1 response regulator [Alkalicaulis satelles]
MTDMTVVGDFTILIVSLVMAAVFLCVTRKLKRHHAGPRLIAAGQIGVAISALIDASEHFAGPVRDALGLSVDQTEAIAYAGYTISLVVLVIGFVRWIPLISRLDQEVAARTEAEASLQRALERSRQFNAGLEALGRAHMDEGWNAGRLVAEASRRVSHLMGATRVSVWRLDEDGQGLTCQYLYDAEKPAADGEKAGHRIERDINPAYFDVIESGRIVCVTDAFTDPITAAFGDEYLQPIGIHAILDAPIRTGRGVRGVLSCEHVGATRNWTPEEESFVAAVAQYVAVAYLADNAETLASELKSALKEARGASAAKSAFLANMSHELRTPLNGVLGMAQALDGPDLREADREKVGTIIESGQQLLGVLNDVLDLSKIEAGRVDITPEAADPGGLISATCDLFRDAASAKGLTLRCELEALPRTAVLDPLRVRQCLSNLIANAVKFTDSGAVSVTARAEPVMPDGWRIAITIADTGPGIPDDVQSRLFQRFSQADATSARRHGGAGLGLVIARELARRMGGDISVDSAPGEGARFTFSFRADVVGQSGADQPDAVNDLAVLAGAQVLLVDDNAINRLVARSFMETAGAQVTEAQGGQEALHLFAAHRFDLVLLDAHMPVMSGKETLRRLRTLPHGATPVVALTADAMQGDEARYLAMGMDGYVAKPVDKNALLTVSARLITAARAPRKDAEDGVKPSASTAG